MTTVLELFQPADGATRAATDRLVKDALSSDESTREVEKRFAARFLRLLRAPSSLSDELLMSTTEGMKRGEFDHLVEERAAQVKRVAREKGAVGFRQNDDVQEFDHNRWASRANKD
ncbi:hypothetical protein [Paraburkholderia phenazinium]|jgi:hypothetical protein|uniref:Uncharacterized protein n=1 Tax=Paraburkholderia phenazinium TaxID=60549 RepID=A0A1G7UK22_9BURK|nr:hypothetical protein [Paraburkholderia phenazinium]SDG47080.1 hypothetical protein SAMN05216466_103466 [Paraburkholderia phenazinium]